LSVGIATLGDSHAPPQRAGVAAVDNPCALPSVHADRLWLQRLWCQRV